MTSAHIRAPDEQETKLLNHLRQTARGLMQRHGGHAIVMVVKPDGVAMQGCVESLGQAAAAAHALLTFAAQVAEAQMAQCECKGCEATAKSVAGALATLETARVAVPRAHQVH